MSSASVEEVRNRLDIVDVISETVPLKKAGRTFKAPCPFHNERTPSFIVNPDRQTWHCFGACGVGGDVFSFVMKRENLDFGETLRTLADKVGVVLPTRDQAAESKTDRLLEANKAAAAFFQNQLLTSPAAAQARGYIRQRGLSEQVVKDFQLGYCPPTSGALLSYLSQKGFSTDECIEAGLGTRNESGQVREMFQARLIFPIRDQRSRVIGFGGRAMSTSGPKYINTRRTGIFDKSNTLYGADRAKEPSRQLKRIVVVEGYMDVITAHQFGFKNVVASMGTSLTEKQVELLKKLSTRVSLALDADTAGQEATLRSLKSSWQSFYRSAHALQERHRRTRNELSRFLHGPPDDQNIDIIMLPAGDDPDSLIRKDIVSWSNYLDSPKPLIDYLIEKEIDRADLDSPGTRYAIIKEFRDLIVTTKFSDQDALLQKLARQMNVDVDTLKRDINPGAYNEVIDELRDLLVTSGNTDQDEFTYRLARLLGVKINTVKDAFRPPSHVPDSQTLSETQPDIRNEEVSTTDNSMGATTTVRKRQRRATRAAPHTQAQPNPKLRGDVLEEYVLAALLKNPSLFSEMGDANPEWFQDPAYRDVFEKLISGWKPEDILYSVSEHVSEPVSRLLSTALPADSLDELIKGIRECVTRLESRRLKRLKQAEESALGDEEALGDAVEAIRGRALAINEGLKRIHTKGTVV